MTELTIVPNLERKSLKLHGAIAAGEHVKVTVVGGADWVSPDGEMQTLRLRFIFGDRLVAVFPTVTVADVTADDTGTLTAQDITAWQTHDDDPEIAEGDAVCELNLNTTTAEKYLKFGGMCLVVLDDPYGNTLYGSGESDAEGDTVYGTTDCEVLPWPMRDVVEVPQNLDGVPPINVRKYLATWTGYDSLANTEIEIEPNYAKKSLKFRGAVASGEHVRVTVKGAAEWANAEGAELRLRVIFGCKQVAMFPIITTADVAADTTNTLTGEDVMEWDTTDGENAVCMLNLNTVPAEKYLKFGGTCLWILDDRANHTLYATGEFDVMPWPKRNGADVPYNLDEYPDIVAELQEAWAAYQTELNAAWEAHQQEVATAIASKANALDLTSHVGNTSNPHSVTKAQVGLGNVDNTADADKPISTATQNALDGKQPVIQDLADIRSGAAAGATALQEHQDISGKADKSATYTKSEVDNLVASATPGDYDSLKGRVSAVEGKVPSEASASNQLADKAYVGTEISSAIDAVTDGAPGAFDTLKEIADWIGDKGSGAQQVIDQVANKVDKVEGKGLSTNDFTTAEKEKLAGIAPGATAVTVDSALSGSSANPVENRAVKAALDERPTRTEIEYGFSPWTVTDPNGEPVSGTGPSLSNGTWTYSEGGVVFHAQGDADAVSLVFTSESGVVREASRACLVPKPSATAPAADGVASAGSSVRFSRGDHVHPTDATRAPVASPAFTGSPTAPTPDEGDDSTRVATTAFVQNAVAGAIDDAGSMDNAKADKRIPAAIGNLAALDAEGNLADSGKQPSDFAPSSNIQKAALASDVQTSLGLADSALQVHQELVYEDGAWTTVSLGDGVELVDGPRYDAEHYPDFPWSANFSIYGTSSTLQLSGPEDATELKFGPNGSIAVFSRVPAGYILREPTRSRSRSAAEPAKVQPAGFYADRSEMSVTAGTGADADKATIQLKDGLSATVLTQHQDISGKADSADVETALAGKADNSDVSDLRDYVDGLFNYKAITASLSIAASSPSLGSGESQTVREKGRTVTAATFHYVFNKVPVEAKFGTANPPTEAVDNPALSGDIAKTGMLVTSATTWRISGKEAATPGKTQQTATASVTISFYNGVYYGVAAIPGTLDSAFILGLANKSLRSGKLASFTVNAGAGQHIWYALPESMGACAFKVGGFDGGFTLADTIQFTNSVGHAESYRVYRSDNPSLGSTTVNVS